MSPFVFKLIFLILFALLALYLKTFAQLKGKALGLLTALIIVVPPAMFLFLFNDSYAVPIVVVVTAQLCYLVWLVIKDRGSPDLRPPPDSQ